MTTTTTHAADVDEARAEVASLKAQLAAKVEELDTASAAGDLEAVKALRDEIAVLLPSAIDGACLRVVDAHLAQARADVEPSTESARAAKETADASYAEFQATQQRLVDLEQRTLAERRVEAAARGAAETARRRVRELEEERVRLRESTERERRARARRLAGLPEPVDAPVAPEPDRAPGLRAPYIENGRVVDVTDFGNGVRSIRPRPIVDAPEAVPVAEPYRPVNTTARDEDDWVVTETRQPDGTVSTKRMRVGG